MKFIQRVHLLQSPNAGTKRKDEAYQTLQTVFFFFFFFNLNLCN